MGQQQSKDELLYQQVNNGNIEGIKALHREGAGLEWIDKEEKTPLTVACTKFELYNVAKTLIELGANVNAYRPGRRAGTPLHHAVQRGLEQTVKLLLSHGANALVMNDDSQTPLDVARVKKNTNIVRAIESHICLFSGWLRELYGPSFLEVLAPQLLSRKVWVVVLPCGSRNLTKPFKLELAIYPSQQDSQPRTLIALWKANMEEPKFNQPDPAVIISDISSIPRRWRQRRGILSSREARCKLQGGRQTRIKLAPACETDKQQLQRFSNACKGIPQVMHQNFPFNNQAPAVPTTAPSSSAEDIELAMAINASIQSAMEAMPPFVDANHSSGANASSSSHSACEIHEVGSSGNSTQQIQNLSDIPAVVQTTVEIPAPASLPSVPPIKNAIINDGPVHYPSVDFSPVDLSSPVVENLPAMEDGRKEDTAASSSCVICLDAAVEGACIPCGHMAGCMSCLNEIKTKKWGCPVCRANIDQVIRLYAV
ncbi:putative E3 ubiquitin-protein ligase XBAT35 [Camellia lanceoleosa]|uniref:E3 ubiquitin-protein ligase XBAT35 n=1 Tax=Camellia lanceoleosa TaxID=1840588 RepID=A0ACC0GU72_9ERIC|nr:putative E3 ubiquitin-protein ligase XBAT35 [Camellia lanceoleosa]